MEIRLDHLTKAWTPHHDNTFWGPTLAWVAGGWLLGWGAILYNIYNIIYNILYILYLKIVYILYYYYIYYIIIYYI